MVDTKIATKDEDIIEILYLSINNKYNFIDSM